MPTMAELNQVLQSLKSTTDYQQASSLLSKAKILLLKNNALTPSPQTSPDLLYAARSIYEIGALTTIRARNPDAFVRYYHQLAPFYDLPENVLPAQPSERNKITGLYLLLLLVKGDYSGFHTELEGLEMRGVQTGSPGGEDGDRFLMYPVRLERWLMEGSYDQVWRAMSKAEYPSEEFSVFHDILTPRIRAEIASCSERAYPSLPISSTKNLLFLPSEGAVVEFAQTRGWEVRDGRIYFPEQNLQAGEQEEREDARQTMSNVVGYARELETIV